MQPIELSDFKPDLPDRQTVSVIMRKSPSDHPWIDFSYQMVGVLVGEDVSTPGEEGYRLIHSDGEIEQYLMGGLTLSLHPDECESYYHNLKSPRPGCFIVAGQTEDPNDMPVPYLVSLSFDEVHAYLEGDEPIYAVDIPPGLYQWVEAYILTHYTAEKKTKRKLKNWSEQSEGRIAGKPAGNS